MFCPSCGKEIPDDAGFCPECGVKTVAESQSEQAVSTESAEQAEVKEDVKTNAEGNKYQPPKEHAKKTNTTTIAVVAGVLITLIVCGGIGMGLYFNTTNRMNAAIASNQAEADTASQDTTEGIDESSDALTDEEGDEGTTRYDESEATTGDSTDDAGNASAKIVSASDIVMNVSDVQPANLPSFQKATVASTNASSTVAQAGYDNSSAQIVDGKDETSWQEGVDGDGVGESVTLTFAQPVKVKYIGLKLGNWRDDTYYTENNVPTSLNIQMGDVSSNVNFGTDKVQHWVALSDEWETSSLTLTIEGVYAGTEWQDTCIAEVVVYGE